MWNYSLGITKTKAMVLIPDGVFLMGDTLNEGYTHDLPVHEVYLDAYYIDAYEVTNAQYKKFIDATGHPAPAYWDNPIFNAPNQPVVGVSWYDAVAYAEWSGKRLPTEAEWEKAARGGLEGMRYPWGNTLAHNDANYDGTGGIDIWTYSAPVGSFPPNGYGLYDMAGNVLEWCLDWYDPDYYSISPRNNPKGPDTGTYRVLRGGSWHSYFEFVLRVTNRLNYRPTNTDSAVGFRCAEVSNSVTKIT